MVFHCLLSSKHYSLVTFPVQQEVATEAALTLVPHAVVLAIYTHSTFFCGTLRHPVLNLIKVQKEKTKETSCYCFLCICFLHIITRMPQGWQTLTLLGSRGKSHGFSRAFLCSSRDKHTALFPLQNSRHGRQVPPPLAEPTNRGLHFSQCLPWKWGKKKSSPVDKE